MFYAIANLIEHFSVKTQQLLLAPYVLNELPVCTLAWCSKCVPYSTLGSRAGHKNLMVSEILYFCVLLNGKCKQVQLVLACMYYS